MHSLKIDKYKQSLKLTKYQRAIIVGTLLGDGHLESKDNGRTYRLKIEHSISQKQYVDWLYGQFREWTGDAPKSRMVTSGFSYRNGKGTTAYGFSTYSHGAFRFYGQQFYPNGKKIIPVRIAKILTPVSIAIWYFDDGSWKSNKHRTFIIHTHGYTKADLQKAQSALGRFGIHARLHRQIRLSGTYLRLYIQSASAEKFRALIIPMIKHIPSMSYKLGNNLPKK